ncbi:MAG: hypothetical protein LZF62_440041 [Nitrospira sp.]|nr:MAG: hypothetical protein LZF62_440041 [Nitrospira sp.]
MPATTPVLSECQVDLAQIFPKQNKDVHSTALEGESVLLNLSTGRYYSLNAVGSVVWEQCTGALSLAAICSSISERFDVTSQDAQSDLLDLIVQFRQEGLLHTERR